MQQLTRSLQRGVLLAVLALCVAGPATAGADTIGQNLTAFAGACSPELTVVDPAYEVPAPGTITSFSYQSMPDYIYGDPTGTKLAFKVFRPTGDATYDVVGGTAVQTLKTFSDLETFAPAEPIKVRRGDVLGYWVGDRFLPGCASYDVGDASGQFTADPLAGESVGLSICCFGHLNVTAEFTPSLHPPAAPAPFALDAASDSGASSSDGVTSDATPTFTGAAEPGSTVTVYVDGEAAGSTQAAAEGGEFSVTTAALSDGSHQVTAVAANEAGDGDVSTPLDVTIDTVAPSVSIARPADGATYGLHEPVAAAYSCADGGSGVSGCTGTVADGAPLDTASVGPKAFAATGTDLAGNRATRSAGYAVVYAFSGFAAPVDAGSVNAAKAGRTIPVKWRLTDQPGAAIATASSFVSITSQGGLGACVGTPDAIETYTNASGLQYLGDGYWQFNWQTPKTYSGQCRTMTLTLADGVEKTATFHFK
jgi:hypothetical protein